MSLFKWLKKPASRSNASEATAAEKAAAATAAAEKAAKETAAAATRENATTTAEDITGETELEIPMRENGKTEKVTLAALVEAYNARDDGMGLEDSLEIDGKQLPVKELIAGYVENEKRKLNTKEEDDEEEKKKKAKEKENAEAEEKAKKEKENAKKASHFRVILNARAAGSIDEGPRSEPDDIMSRCNRGNSRYGSAVVAGKN